SYIVFEGIPEPAQVTRALALFGRRLAHTLDQKFSGFQPGGYVVALRIVASVFSKKIDGFFQFQVVKRLDALVHETHVLREEGNLPRLQFGIRLGDRFMTARREALRFPNLLS